MLVKKSVFAVACLVAGCSDASQEDGSIPHPQVTGHISSPSSFEQQVAKAEAELSAGQPKGSHSDAMPKPAFAESDMLTDEERAVTRKANISPQARAVLEAVLVAEKRDERLGVKHFPMPRSKEELEQQMRDSELALSPGDPKR